MKKVSVINKLSVTAWLSIFALISCDNDDQEGSPVLGTWKATKTMTISGNNGVILLQNPITGCSAGAIYEFRTNGDYEYRNSCTSSWETGTFKYSEDSMVITLYINVDGGDNEMGTETLYSLTASEMQTITGKSDYDQDGVQDTSVIVYTRQ